MRLGTCSASAVEVAGALVSRPGSPRHACIAFWGSDFFLGRLKAMRNRITSCYTLTVIPTRSSTGPPLDRATNGEFSVVRVPSGILGCSYFYSSLVCLNNEGSKHCILICVAGPRGVCLQDGPPHAVPSGHQGTCMRGRGMNLPRMNSSHLEERICERSESTAGV